MYNEMILNFYFQNVVIQINQYVNNQMDLKYSTINDCLFINCLFIIIFYINLINNNL